MIHSILEQKQFHIRVIFYDNYKNRYGKVVLSSDQLSPSGVFIELGKYYSDDVRSVEKLEQVDREIVEIVEDMTERHFNIVDSAKPRRSLLSFLRRIL